MKRYFVIAALASIPFTTLSASPISARTFGPSGCSTSAVSGFYGFTYSGQAILSSGTVPVAAVGNFSTNAAGDLVGTEMNNLGGTAAYQTIKGKIVVHHDCSASLIADVYQKGTLVRTSYIHIQYDDNAAEVRLIFQKVILPDQSELPVVITGDGKRVASDN